MAKVITFSRKFPQYHPKNGMATYFVEKFLKQRGVNYSSDNYIQKLCGLNTKNLAKGKLSFEDIESFVLSLQERTDEKSHTIRGGNRFNNGEYFSPRCWFGKPYNSPQIIFWEDTEVKKSYPFAIFSKEDKDKLPSGTGIFVNNKHITPDKTMIVANNDGLETSDFLHWFKYPSRFYGQIICWNENIQY